MKAVIFAAGKGTRLGNLTKKTPKPLLKINKRPILEHTFLSLPSEITEMIVVIGYLGDKIKKKFGDNFNGKPIFYVEQNELSGTAAALHLTKSRLGKEKFLVLNADDIYSKKDLSSCLDHSLAFGVFKMAMPPSHFWTIEIGLNGAVKNSKKVSGNRKESLIGTGVYVLDKRIFRYKPVKIKNGSEYGLPQTIFKMAKRCQIQAVEMDFWFPINTPEDLKKAKKKLKRC